MSKIAYYNEHDPKAAAWLRELIAQGHIAPGIVDERSIEDVLPSELTEFTQCHFFAGIGVWSYALRRAGWPDDRPVWTGSCPCQPFSAAGQRQGESDERHLWPAWLPLIKAVRPTTIFGEQVASSEVVGSQLEAAFVIAVRSGEFARANKLAKQLVRTRSFHYSRRWIDLVASDMASIGYAMRPVVLGAHSVGAPHIRQRLWFVAVADAAGEQCGARRFGAAGDELSTIELGGLENSGSERCDGQSVCLRFGESQESSAETSGRSPVERMADAGLQSSERIAGTILGTETPGSPKRLVNGRVPVGYQYGGSIGIMADAAGGGQRISWSASGPSGYVDECVQTDRPGPVNGFWRAADWIFCRDGKWRPVEPGAFPLADGAAARVGRLRGYGNAIVAPVAEAFIESYLESER